MFPKNRTSQWVMREYEFPRRWCQVTDNPLRHIFKFRKRRSPQEAAEALRERGLCEKCTPCIIYEESCNLSIRVSVCVYGFCVQPLIMSWIQEQEITRRRCCRWLRVPTKSAELPELLRNEHDGSRLGVLTVASSPKLGGGDREIPVIADVPDQFQRLSP